MTGLLQIVLPDHTIRWCDGAFFIHDGNVFRGRDSIYGTVAKVDTLQEGVGDSVPALTMTILPPDSTAAADLSSAGNQTARVTFMLAEYDYDTGVITSADVQFNGQVDQSVFTIGRGVRKLDMSVVSLVERVFERDIGNTLNPTFQKSIWPDDTGHDQATGLAVAVAWGTERPTGGGGVGGYGGYGGGSRGGTIYTNLREY